MTTNEWLVTALIIIAAIGVTFGLYRVVIWLFTLLLKSRREEDESSKREDHDS